MGASVQDISSKARVSRSTVYDVLRDPEDKRYNKQTRKRILKVASEIQYVPNSLAKALRRNASFNIGIVGAQWPDPHTEKGIGAADRIVPSVPCLTEIAERLPNATLEVVPGGGHLLLPLASQPWQERLENLQQRAGAARE